MAKIKIELTVEDSAADYIFEQFNDLLENGELIQSYSICICIPSPFDASCEAAGRANEHE